MAVTNGSGQAVAQGQTFEYTWAAVPNGNTGNFVNIEGGVEVSVQVEGTFGAGGSVNIEGSNDGTHGHTLNDLKGNALTITAAQLSGVLERPKSIRPNVTAGDGTTALTVTLIVRKGH